MRESAGKVYPEYMDPICWYVLGAYTLYLFYIRWRVGRLELWSDGHELDHADDERLLTKVKETVALSAGGARQSAGRASSP